MFLAVIFLYAYAHICICMYVQSLCLTLFLSLYLDTCVHACVYVFVTACMCIYVSVNVLPHTLLLSFLRLLWSCTCVWQRVMCSRTQPTCIVCKAMYSRTHPHHASWCEFASCELMRVHEHIAQVSATGERNVFATCSRIQTTSLAVPLAFSLSLLPFSNICSGFFSISSTDSLNILSRCRGTARARWLLRTVSLSSHTNKYLCRHHYIPINTTLTIITYQSITMSLSIHSNQQLCFHHHIPINTTVLLLHTNQLLCFYQYIPINNYVSIITFQSIPRLLLLHTNQSLCLYQYIPINNYVSIIIFQSITMSLSLFTNQGPCLSHDTPIHYYGVATVSRLLKNICLFLPSIVSFIGLFCKRDL